MGGSGFFPEGLERMQEAVVRRSFKNKHHGGFVLLCPRHWLERSRRRREMSFSALLVFCSPFVGMGGARVALSGLCDSQGQEDESHDLQGKVHRHPLS